MYFAVSVAQDFHAFSTTTKSKTHDSCSQFQMYGLDPFIASKIYEK